MLKIVEKKGLVDVWPDTQQHIKCVVSSIDKPEETFESDLHTSEVELLERLNQLQKSMKLQPAIMNELWSKIEDYGQRKYEEGSNAAQDEG